MSTLGQYLTPKLNLVNNQTELDARIIPFERCNGKDLNDLIRSSVIKSQEWVETDLPSVLRVTQKQFASLNLYSEEMFHTTDRFFIVHDRDGGVLGVMEVEIDDEIDVLENIDDIIKESEALLAQKDFTKMTLKELEIDPTKTNVLTPENFKDPF